VSPSKVKVNNWGPCNENSKLYLQYSGGSVAGLFEYNRILPKERYLKYEYVYCRKYACMVVAAFK
jgi:hypothetical protein